VGSIFSKLIAKNTERRLARASTPIPRIFPVPRKALPVTKAMAKQTASRIPVAKLPETRLKPVEQVGFVKKLFKSAGRTITRPISAITGKDIVSRSGTIFAKGFGKDFDKLLGKTTKATGIITAGVVGGKLLAGASKGNLASGTKEKSGFLGKIFKGDLKSKLSGLTGSFVGDIKTGLKTGLSSLTAGTTDIDNNSFLGIGNKKRREDKEDKDAQMRMMLMIAAAAIAFFGLMIAVFKK